MINTNFIHNKVMIGYYPFFFFLNKNEKKKKEWVLLPDQ